MMRITQILTCALLAMTGAFGAETPALLESEVEIEPRPLVSAGLDLQYVPIQYSRYDWSEGRQSGKNGHGVHLAVEMIPFEDTYGKVGFGLGTGFYAIPNARFESRSSTLTTIPLELFVSYRFDYVADQIVVPFVKLGANATLSRQRGFGDSGAWRTYRGWDIAGGLELCMNRIDPISMRGLHRDLGVDNSYLLVEYLRSRPLGALENRPNLSHEEFRIGFRFEM